MNRTTLAALFMGIVAGMPSVKAASHKPQGPTKIGAAYGPAHVPVATQAKNEQNSPAPIPEVKPQPGVIAPDSELGKAHQRVQGRRQSATSTTSTTPHVQKESMLSSGKKGVSRFAHHHPYWFSSMCGTGAFLLMAFLEAAVRRENSFVRHYTKQGWHNMRAFFKAAKRALLRQSEAVTEEVASSTKRLPKK